MRSNSDNNDDEDIEFYPTIEERVDYSDMIIEGHFKRSNDRRYVITVNEVLKGSFNASRFYIQDSEIDNGCYPDPIDTILTKDTRVIVFLIKSGDIHLIQDCWNLVQSKDESDYDRVLAQVKREIINNQPSRESGGASSSVSRNRAALLARRRVLEDGPQTRQRVEEIKTIDAKLS